MLPFRRSLACIFGINAYPRGIAPLRTAVADAEELAYVLRELHGFEAIVRTDEQATLEGIRDTLSQLSRELREDDRVLFYFAGHGIALDASDGPAGYLLPKNASRDSIETYFPMSELDAWLASLPCRHGLAILDCCFAGSFRWNSYRRIATGRTRLHRERFRWYVEGKAWQAIASAAHDQLALDLVVGRPVGFRQDGATHSPFASALIDGLRGAADAPLLDGLGDGVITVTELFTFIESRLHDALPGQGSQTPVLWPLQKHEKGQFVFLVPGRTPDLLPAPTLDDSTNPWRSLKFYDSADSPLFFGRASLVKQLSQRVTELDLIVVTGPSGAGKSSLVRAGLLPTLEPTAYRVRVLRPSVDFYRELNNLVEIQPTEPNGLNVGALQARMLSNDKRTEVLVIDQAEELFTTASEGTSANLFLAFIESSLASSQQGLKIVLVVRSDFESQFLRSEAIARRWTAARFPVPSMTQDEVRRVIEGPAGVRVLRFESDELVDRLVNDVAQMPGYLPLLSCALSEMYSHFLSRAADDRTITFADYGSLKGGIAGSIRGRAKRVMGQLDPECRATLRRVLMRLVAIDSGEFTRRRAPKRELEFTDREEQSRVEFVLKLLDSERLIVIDQVGDTSFVELAHDALIVGWDQVLDWAREDLARLIHLRRLTRDSELWASSSGSNPGLLWSDPARLQVALDLDGTEHPGLNSSEHAFVLASGSRSRRNFWIRNMLMVLLFCLTIGATWFGYSTDVQRNRSESNRLALASRTASEIDQALLLAVAGHKMESNIETRGALFGALVRRAHLVRVMHGADGAVGDLFVLPNGRTYARSSKNSGTLLYWLPGSAAAQPVDEISSGFDDIGLAGNFDHVVVRRGESIEIYRFEEGSGRFVRGLNGSLATAEALFTHGASSVAFATTKSRQLHPIDIRTGQIGRAIALPTSASGKVQVYVGSRKSVVVVIGRTLWMLVGNSLKAIPFKAPARYGIAHVEIDEIRGVITGLIGLEQTEDSTVEVEEKKVGTFCWDLTKFRRIADCPMQPPVAGPWQVSSIRAASVLASRRDLRTGLQRTDLREKTESGWAVSTLRNDPTFVTSMRESADRSRIFVGTIDGELAEYSLDRFAGGSARVISNHGEIATIDWTEEGCAVVVIALKRLERHGCAKVTGATATKIIEVNETLSTELEVSKDGRSFQAIDSLGRLVIWDSHLEEVARLSPPEASGYSPRMSVSYDDNRRRVFLVIGEGRTVWRHQMGEAGWHKLFTAKFDVRTLSLSRSGDQVYIGSSTSGDVLSISPDSGLVRWSTLLPSAHYVGHPLGATSSVFVSGLASRHNLYRLDAKTGRMTSDAMNPFSGPSHVLGVSADERLIFITGVGIPDGQTSKRATIEAGLSIQLVDGERLLPLGESVQTESFSYDVVAFSPDGSMMAYGSTETRRLALIPMNEGRWSDAACRAAGRDLTKDERARFGVQTRSVCMEHTKAIAKR